MYGPGYYRSLWKEQANPRDRKTFAKSPQKQYPTNLVKFEEGGSPDAHAPEKITKQRIDEGVRSRPVITKGTACLSQSSLLHIDVNEIVLKVLVDSGESLRIVSQEAVEY